MLVYTLVWCSYFSTFFRANPGKWPFERTSAAPLFEKNLSEGVQTFSTRENLILKTLFLLTILGDPTLPPDRAGPRPGAEYLQILD